MDYKTSKLSVIVGMKCPQCRQEKMFKHGTYNITKFHKMHRFCPNCNADFEPEPGFYFGAMYISYGVNIAILITFFLATLLLFDPKETWVYFIAVFTPAAILLPFNFRVSRSIMLHLFGGLTYDPEKAKMK